MPYLWRRYIYSPIKRWTNETHGISSRCLINEDLVDVVPFPPFFHRWLFLTFFSALISHLLLLKISSRYSSNRRWWVQLKNTGQSLIPAKSFVMLLHFIWRPPPSPSPPFFPLPLPLPNATFTTTHTLRRLYLYFYRFDFWQVTISSESI